MASPRSFRASSTAISARHPERPWADSARAPKVYRRRLAAPTTSKFLGAPEEAPVPSAFGFGGPLAPMPSPDPEFRRPQLQRPLHWRTVRRRLAAGSQRRRRPESLHRGGQRRDAIYNKTGTLLASFTEDQLWSGAGTTPCNGNSQGDPIVVYDWLADRFVLTWFAFRQR